jgi:hypothetical protein
MLVAGSLNYTGAAHLSAAAAARAGAGLVTLAIPAPLHATLAGALPEVTWLPLAGPDGVHTAAGVQRLLAGLQGYDALLVGPGFTATDDARGFVEALFCDAGLPKNEWAGRTVVDLQLPGVLAELAAAVPGIPTAYADQVREAIRTGLRGPIVDVTDEDGSGVTITVD